MSRFKYISIVEYEDRDRREARLRKTDKTGSQLAIPTPDNDVDSIESQEWTRVSLIDITEFGLEKMAKKEFVDWWVANKDDGHDLVERVLEEEPESGKLIFR